MGNKRYLLVEEAVDEGFFVSPRQAVELRHKRRGPPYSKPNGGRVVYRRDDLEKWIEAGRVQTFDALPLHQRTGDGR